MSPVEGGEEQAISTRMRSGRVSWLLVAFVALACKEPARTADSAAQKQRPFTASDLAAATAVDARLARVTLLAFELELAAHHPNAGERASALAPRLSEAVSQAEAAVATVTNPTDRTLAERALAAARPWPALAREMRGGSVPAALASSSDDLGSAIFDYRRARSTYRADLAPETGPALAFARARAALEAAEAKLGEGHRVDAWEPTAERARVAASALDGNARAPALRWVQAESLAVQALLAMGSASEENRLALSLRYQEAKADALDALAEYRRLERIP